MPVQVSKTIQDLACPTLDCPDINLLILPSVPADIKTKVLFKIFYTTHEVISLRQRLERLSLLSKGAGREELSDEVERSAVDVDPGCAVADNRLVIEILEEMDLGVESL